MSIKIKYLLCRSRKESTWPGRKWWARGNPTDPALSASRAEPFPCFPSFWELSATLGLTWWPEVEVLQMCGLSRTLTSCTPQSTTPSTSYTELAWWSTLSVSASPSKPWSTQLLIQKFPGNEKFLVQGRVGPSLGQLRNIHNSGNNSAVFVDGSNIRRRGFELSFVLLGLKDILVPFLGNDVQSSRSLSRFVPHKAICPCLELPVQKLWRFGCARNDGSLRSSGIQCDQFGLLPWVDNKSVHSGIRGHLVLGFKGYGHLAEKKMMTVFYQSKQIYNLINNSWHAGRRAIVKIDAFGLPLHHQSVQLATALQGLSCLQRWSEHSIAYLCESWLFGREVVGEGKLVFGSDLYHIQPIGVVFYLCFLHSYEDEIFSNIQGKNQCGLKRRQS